MSGSVAFLSDAWFELRRSTGAALTARPGVDVGVQYKVTGGPDGDVVFHVVYADGRVAQAGLGALDDPSFTVATSYDDLARSARGEIDPNAAFMQGRWKLTGDMGAVMALQAVTQSPEHKAAEVALDEQTTY